VSLDLFLSLLLHFDLAFVLIDTNGLFVLICFELRFSGPNGFCIRKETSQTLGSATSLPGIDDFIDLKIRDGWLTFVEFVGRSFLRADKKTTPELVLELAAEGIA
jgi:hypothetical protein